MILVEYLLKIICSKDCYYLSGNWLLGHYKTAHGSRDYDDESGHAQIQLCEGVPRWHRSHMR